MAALYLDSSAIVKLVVDERESGALRSFLRRRRSSIVASAIARVEVVRAVHSQGAEATGRARIVIGRLRLVGVDDIILDDAASLAGPTLRSLDALHLATARALGRDVAAIVTYDDRMADAARAVDFDVRAPGA